MNKYTVELKSGTSCASPVINKYSFEFDTLEFLVLDDGTFDDCTFAVVYSLCGKTGMDIAGGDKVTMDKADGNIVITWTLGKSISCMDGVVIYQVVAYKPGEDGKTCGVWYHV